MPESSFHVMPICRGKVKNIFDSPYICVTTFLLLQKTYAVKKPVNISEEQKKLMKQLGGKIKKLRKDQKKGYIQLSEEIGIPRNTYYNMECGTLNFQFSSLCQIILYYKNNHNILPEEFFKDL